jgi:hypothetical protein
MNPGSKISRQDGLGRFGGLKTRGQGSRLHQRSVNGVLMAFKRLAGKCPKDSNYELR